MCIIQIIYFSICFVEVLFVLLRFCLFVEVLCIILISGEKNISWALRMISLQNLVV